MVQLSHYMTPGGGSMQKCDSKKPDKRDCPERHSGQFSRSYSGQYSRRYLRRKRKQAIFRAVLAGGFLTMAAVLYLYTGIRYEGRYLPNTVINGRDVSGLDAAQVKAAMDSDVKQYVLTIEERDGAKSQISGADIGIYTVYDGTLESILEEQNGLLWGVNLIRGQQHEIKTMVSYEAEKLSAVIDSLPCMNPGQVTAPVDAHLSYVGGGECAKETGNESVKEAETDNHGRTGLQIIPEIQGNELIPEAFSERITTAIHNLERRINLEEAGVYKEPHITSDNPALKAQTEVWKPYADTTVTYRFGSRTEVLDGSTTFHWLSDDGQGNVIISRDKAAEYVKKLAETYNTAYHAKQLKTSYGPVVTIVSGHYGWMIHQEKETEALLDILYSCQSQEREPVYSQKAASHEGPDYGDTYVEMNLTAQHMYFYKNGKLMVESDFVSGNEAKGWSTPAGAFSLTYKQRNAVLKGKNYKTPVSYWMPFNGNIGMHDGYWRSSFGGTIYKKNGSHGCVNLPPAVAKTVYENIEAGMPVLCYHLEGTEGKESKQPETKTPAKQIDRKSVV